MPKLNQQTADEGFNPLREDPPTPWEAECFYLVSVSMRPGNPPHKSLLYTGFLDNRKRPSGYAHLYNPSYEPVALPLDHDHRMQIVIIQKIGALLT
jgi:hypothetical protein